MSEISHVTDTALWVAHYRAEESKRPDAVFKDPLAEILAGEKGPRIAREMPYGRVLAWIMAVRTVAIDRLIVRALANGVDTVVNLGAGLDTRPYRMELPPELKWIEVDFPDMINYKAAKLKDEKPRCRLERIALDLSQRSQAQALYARLGRESKNILVITEGVVIYLSPEEVKALAEDLSAVPSIRYWIQDFRNFVRGGWRVPRRYGRGLRNAPFRFLVADTLAFLNPLGWDRGDVIYTQEEARRLKRPIPVVFPWNLLMKLVSKTKLQAISDASGYLLLRNRNFRG